MDKPQTFRECMILARMIPQIKAFTFENITEQEALGLLIVQRVREWAAEPFSENCCPTWPVANVPVPVSRKDKENDERWTYLETYLSDSRVLVMYQVAWFTAGGNFKTRQHVIAYDRQSDTDYWPTRSECQAAVTQWASALYTEMLTTVGQDCDCEGPDVTPADHWRWAKRRYGLKDNQTCRLLYLCRLDPEGRHRHNPWLPLPPHVETWLRYADFLCGVKAGVAVGEITADHIYASGAELDEHDLIKLFKKWAAAEEQNSGSSPMADGTCALSDLPIGYGDKVIGVLILRKDSPDTHESWDIIAPYVEGAFEDYGRVTLSAESAVTADRILDKLRPYILPDAAAGLSALSWSDFADRCGAPDRTEIRIATSASTRAWVRDLYDAGIGRLRVALGDLAGDGYNSTTTRLTPIGGAGTTIAYLSTPWERDAAIAMTAKIRGVLGSDWTIAVTAAMGRRGGFGLLVAPSPEAGARETGDDRRLHMTAGYTNLQMADATGEIINAGNPLALVWIRADVFDAMIPADDKGIRDAARVIRRLRVKDAQTLRTRAAFAEEVAKIENRPTNPMDGVSFFAQELITATSREGMAPFGDSIGNRFGVDMMAACVLDVDVDSPVDAYVPVARVTALGRLVRRLRRGLRPCGYAYPGYAEDEDFAMMKRMNVVRQGVIQAEMDEIARVRAEEAAEDEEYSGDDDEEVDSEE